MMQTTDVAVIGAGPAGAIAAHRLAAAGVRVTLLEQAAFPRDKICGDAVTRLGLETLARTGLAAWSAPFKAITALRFTAPDDQVLDIALPPEPEGSACRIIPRIHLDARLAQAAVEAGAVLREGVRVQRIDIDEGEARVHANGDVVHAALVILAEGSNAALTRRLGLLSETCDLLAVRQYLKGDADPGGPVEFHFQPAILPGYVWMFPEGDGRLNIGAGTYTRRVRDKDADLKAIVAAFKAHHPITAERLAQTEPDGPIQGHLLHTHLGGTRTHSARVLVAGDAAGLVSPFTGEGIAAGMWSGDIAAAHALTALQRGDLSAASLAPYTRKLHARYRADQRAGRLLRAVLRFPNVLNRAFRNLRQDAALATLFGRIFLDEASPRRLLAPTTLWRLLR
jgi:geranylgeranyl reductase family protein